MAERSGRVALFIDGVNLHLMATALGIKLDFRRLLALFAERGELVGAFYYTTIVEDPEYASIRPLIDWLGYNGFTVVTKTVREPANASGRRRARGSMCVDLAVRALQMADQVDELFLVSGDGNFRSVVGAIQRRGVRVSVVSTTSTHPPMVADELRRQADEFVDIADFAPAISRR